MNAFKKKTILWAVFTLACCSSVLAQERSFLCKFTTGPRAGQTQDYTGHPSGPLPVGSPCNDGTSSVGVITASKSRGEKPVSGSCRQPSNENDCDKCPSDRSYERCLSKLESE